MSEETLTNIGLSPNEAKIYLALNALGSATAAKISEQSKVHRTNVYDALQKLTAKGLVSEIIKEGAKQYSITKPENLLELLKEKEKSIKELMPLLKLREKIKPQQNPAMIHKGSNSFITLFNGFLEHNKDIFVFGAPPPQKVRGALNEFHEKRQKQKININVIYNFNDRIRLDWTKSLKLCQVRYFPENIQAMQTTFICDEEVLLVVWIEPVMVLQIKNKEIANAYKDYFKILWRDAKT